MRQKSSSGGKELINSGVCSRHQHTKLNYCFDLSRNYQILSAEENTGGFPNRSFILRSPCVHRSLSARVCAPLAFCIRSPFTVHISFTKFCSAFKHRSLGVRSAFIHRSLTVQVGKQNVSGTVSHIVKMQQFFFLSTLGHEFKVVMTMEGSTIIVNFMSPGVEVPMLRCYHINHYSEYALSSTLSIYSTLIAKYCVNGL